MMNPKLSVGGRLWLINALMSIAIVVVIDQAWRTLDRHRLAAESLAAVRLAQFHHQNTIAAHDSIRAEITDPALAGAAVQARIRTHVERARREVLPGDGQRLPKALADGHAALRPDIDRQLARAQRIADATGRNSENAAREAAAFRAAYVVLQRSMQAQAELIDQHVRLAQTNLDQELVATKQRMLLLGGLVVLTAVLLVALIGSSVRHSLRNVSGVARRIAGGELGVRTQVGSTDELGELGDSINTMAQSLESMIERLRAEAEADAFGTHLAEALEMADSETQAHAVVGHAMQVLAPRVPMELHLSEADRLHLKRAVQHPHAGAAGCPVDTSAQCVAVRRGSTQVFTDSEALNACPKLRGRGTRNLCAVCVPVSFMGRSLGVLHASASLQEVPDREWVTRFTTLGMQAGARIGTLRTILRTQQQADTDALTGLQNRRALERVVEDLQSGAQPYALVMADLDYFKRLNDTQGHDAGDRALRVFAELLRRVAGANGHAVRWGGEEFLLLLPALDASQAHEVAQSVRQELARTKLSGGVSVTASFGVADSAMAESFNAVVEICDAALYQAKAAGRNRVTVGAVASLGGVQHPLTPTPLQEPLPAE